MAANQTSQAQPAAGVEEEWTMTGVKPDIMGIAGHQFRINYGVPQDVTDQLYALFDQDGVKYEDIPESLRAYEVKDDAEAKADDQKG